MSDRWGKKEISYEIKDCGCGAGRPNREHLNVWQIVQVTKLNGRTTRQTLSVHGKQTKEAAQARANGLNQQLAME